MTCRSEPEPDSVSVPGPIRMYDSPFSSLMCTVPPGCWFGRKNYLIQLSGTNTTTPLQIKLMNIKNIKCRKNLIHIKLQVFLMHDVIFSINLSKRFSFNSSVVCRYGVIPDI